MTSATVARRRSRWRRWHTGRCALVARRPWHGGGRPTKSDGTRHLHRAGNPLITLGSWQPARDDAGMSDGVPPDRLASEPPVAAIPARVDVREVELPLDPYELDPRDRLTVSRAHLALMADCLGRHGIDIEIPEPRPIPWARHEQQYGLTDEERAARHGYHVPGITDRPRWREPPLPDDIADDWVDWARHRLNQGAPDLPQPQLAQMLGLRAHLLSRQDSRVRAVFSAWRRCMRQTGFSYPDPMAANNDPGLRRRAADRHGDSYCGGRCPVQTYGRCGRGVGGGRDGIPASSDRRAPRPARAHPSSDPGSTSQRASSPLWTPAPVGQHTDPTPGRERSSWLQSIEAGLDIVTR